MKLEEAIKILKEIYTSKGIDGNNETVIKIRKEAVEIVLKELEKENNNLNKETRDDPNKIDLKKAEKRIQDMLSCYDEYKKDYEEGHQSSFELDLEDFKVLRTILQELKNLQQETEHLKTYLASQNLISDYIRFRKRGKYNDR